MRIAICDDEAIQLDELELMLKVFRNELDIKRYYSGEDLLESIQNDKVFDIIFLDIHMHKLNGIETAQKIREFDRKVIIVLVTSLFDYAIQGYSVKAFDFLIKPVSQKNINNVMLNILEELQLTVKQLYTIENKNEKIVLELEDICFIESLKRKTIVHTLIDQFEQYKSITDEEAKLKEFGFIRVQKSFLVNMRHILRIRPSEIILKNKETIPLSSNRFRDVYDQYTIFMMGEI